MSEFQVNESVAWIGLGRMGTAMAARLIESAKDVAVWNRTPDRCDPLVRNGVVRLGRAEDAANYDVVFSMVLDDTALLDVIKLALGTAGAKPRVWIDGSTVSPEAAAKAAAIAQDVGVSYVSAPVSGNPGVVAEGKAIFAISGAPEGLDIAERICLAIGRRVFRVGGGVEANVVKLCTNALLAVTMQSVAEIAVLADSAGVKRSSLMEFINDSAIGSAFTRYKTANVTSLEFPPTFTPEGQRKDIRLAINLAQQCEVPMPVLNTAEVAFSRLVSGGLGEGRDFAALILEVARDAGRQLTPE